MSVGHTTVVHSNDIPDTSKYKDYPKGTVEESDESHLIEGDGGVTRDPEPCTKCAGCTVIVEPLLMLFMLLQYPMSLLIPEYVQQRELERLTGQDNLTTHSNKCLPPANHTTHSDAFTGNLSLASSAASYFELEKSLVSNVPAVLGIIFLGPFSDKAGRRYAIIVPIVGQMIAMFVCTATMFFKWPIQVILVGYFLYGSSGLNYSIFTGCYSYISDITTKVGHFTGIVSYYEPCS